MKSQNNQAFSRLIFKQHKQILIMEKKKLVSKKALEAEEKALLAIKQIEGQKKVQRITIDMPIFLYDRIKEETEKKGYSITGFMLSLVRKHFDEL